MRPKERPSRRLREQMPTQVTAHIATVVEQIPADVELSAMVKMFAVSDTRKHYTTTPSDPLAGSSRCQGPTCPERHVYVPVAPGLGAVEAGCWWTANRQRWRALALVIKAKLEAVETGIVSFEQEFLPHLVLPNGGTVHEWLAPQMEAVYDKGVMPRLLPQLTAGSQDD